MKRLLMATGQSNIDSSMRKLQGYEVVGISESKDNLIQEIRGTNPDILIIGDALRGENPLPISSIIINIRSQFPTLRVVYLSIVEAFELDKLVNLSPLISIGVFDIIYGRSLSLEAIQEILDEPYDYTHPSIKKILDLNKKEDSSKAQIKEIAFATPEEADFLMNDDGSYKNVVSFSSIKPGTGKSFLSVNTAVAIARYGVVPETGKRPKVLLIEADLQNLSVGTLLGIENDKKNLKTAMEKIDSIINDDGSLILDERKVAEVNEFVESCFLPYQPVPNLKALVGSQLSYNEIAGVRGVCFDYLIDTVVDSYDMIVIDTNSSLDHTTTFGLQSKASTCFYVLNLDFNNIRNNNRYKDMLKEIKIDHKVKYVLNEDVTNSLVDEKEELIYGKDLLLDSGFGYDFVGQIPMIPKSVFLNRLYNGTPIVLDNLEYTDRVKYELQKIANSVYPIEGFDKNTEKAQIENNKELKEGKGKVSSFFNFN